MSRIRVDRSPRVARVALAAAAPIVLAACSTLLGWGSLDMSDVRGADRVVDRGRDEHPRYDIVLGSIELARQHDQGRITRTITGLPRAKYMVRIDASTLGASPAEVDERVLQEDVELRIRVTREDGEVACDVRAPRDGRLQHSMSMLRDPYFWAPAAGSLALEGACSVDVRVLVRGAIDVLMRLDVSLAAGGAFK